jgi:CheY-like chemotaxis protein
MLSLTIPKMIDAKLKDRLIEADRASRNLLAIVNDVLDIAKIEADRLILEHTEFQLGELIESTRRVVLPSADEKALDLRISLPLELATRSLLGDPLRLGQVLLNLLSNAIKFSERGSVDLSVSTESEDESGISLRFVVADHGEGIAIEDIAPIFNAFEQGDNSTTRRHGGTGLGLAICKSLVQKMGGAIGVDSTPGLGSRFWFTIRAAVAACPITPAEGKCGGDDAESQIQARYTGVRVLLVEDEPVSREVARSLLDGAGLQVDVAKDGEVALERVRSQRYELLLMDLQMPILGGIEATRLIRALPDYRNVPIIAMTANAFEEDRQNCKDAGMNEFIAKPFKPEDMFATILNCLRAGSGVPAQEDESR